MVLKIIGSGSKGNGYVLESDNEALILECGVPMKDVKKALGFNTSKVVGCLLTHEHGDHAGYIKQYQESYIQIYTSDKTVDTVEIVYGELIHGIQERKPLSLGNFTIIPFYVPHDETPCFAYKIFHPEIGILLFMTDLEYCKYKFKNINHILIESNYSEKLLNSELNYLDHIFRGHMELNTTIEFLKCNYSNDLMNVVLLHLSNSNSDSELFKSQVREVVKSSNVYVADSGLEIKLSLLPF